MTNLLGKTLKNRYRIEESLGRGGMAEVYRVWDLQRDVPLAMKVLREDLAHDVVFLKRFEREARTLSKLQHPNIVRFYGLEQDDMLVFMLMDYIEGESLREEIFRSRGKGMSLDRILEIMQPVCSALNYAHQSGIVHCDLKPGNILIDKNGKVFISDFGIARHIDSSTSTMVGIGTPAYMAPELIKGQDPTPQTDIYALGIVLYEMLTGGERPFTGERATITGTTADKVRWEHLKLEPMPISCFLSQIEPKIEKTIERCLEKIPSSRYENTKDVFADLNTVDSKRTVIENDSTRSDQKNFKNQVIKNNEMPEINDLYIKDYKKGDSSTQFKHLYTEYGLIQDFDLDKEKLVICSMNEILLQDITEQKTFHKIFSNGTYDRVRYYPGGNYLGQYILLESKTDIEMMDTDSSEMFDKLQHGFFSSLIGFDILQGGKSIITLISSGRITYWEKKQYPGFSKVAQYTDKLASTISTIPKRKIILSTNIFDQMNLLSVPDFNLICVIEQLMDSSLVNSVFSPSGKYVAMWDRDSEMRIFNIDSIMDFSKYRNRISKQEENELLLSKGKICPDRFIHCLLFSHNEKNLIAIDGEGILSIHDMNSLKEIYKQPLDVKGINKIMLSGDEKYLITLCRGQRLDYWKWNH